MPTARDLTITSYDGVDLDAREWLPDGPPASWVLLVHGIGGEKTEDDRYERLAVALAGRGIASFAFSFRGHGRSTLDGRSVTIAGEMNDLLTALNHVRARGTRYAIVAASFGTVSTMALLNSGTDDLPWGIVLWNPVLDLHDTFLEPHLPWGIAAFGRANIAAAEPVGLLPFGSLGQVPYVLFAEMRRYDTPADFAALDVPTLVIHGSGDQTVSFDVARRVAASRPSASFLEIVGAEHGFSRPHEDDELSRATLAFLAP